MRFNSLAVDTSKTTNHENGEAYNLSPEMELYKIVCTSILQNQFYTSVNDTLKNIRKLITQCDHNYVAKLAVYAREEMHLRTIPLVLTVELAKVHNGDDLISRLTYRVIQRADEITELLSYYQLSNNRLGEKKLNKLSKQLSKGIAKSFNKFDEYHFGKYNKNTEIRFRDALFLSHASPETPEQKELFEKIINDKLETPYTWETQLSESGKNGRSKKEIWEELIDSRKLGYMATLRNLRNILMAEVSEEHIQKVCDYISNENAVINSKQLPFRFLSAYKTLSNFDMERYCWGEVQESKPVPQMYLPLVFDALEKAVVISSKNISIPENDRVMIAADVSGSMWHPISPRSSIFLYDIGTMLSMLINHNVKYSLTGIFGSTFELFQFPKSSILENTIKILGIQGKVGYATNGHKIIEYLNDNDVSLDKIMVFTDCELYGGSIRKEWETYKRSNPNCKLYLFNLSGYNTIPFSEKSNDVYLISGWNEKIFDMLNNLENGGTVVQSIKSIEL
jgi:hypothetical protein